MHSWPKDASTYLWLGGVDSCGEPAEVGGCSNLTGGDSHRKNGTDCSWHRRNEIANRSMRRGGQGRVVKSDDSGMWQSERVLVGWGP